jgi:hypothetical protein
VSQETTPAPVPAELAGKKALLDAFDSVLRTQAAEREAERAAAAALRKRGVSRLLMVLCTTIVVFLSVYLYVERPEWVFPAPPAAESQAVREASLRIMMANAAQHLERFHHQTGRWPASLEEAGAHGPGILYQRTAEGYRLQGENGEVRLQLESSEPLARFIGHSFEIISRRPR